MLPKLLTLSALICAAVPAGAGAACAPVLDFRLRTLAGAEEVRLCERYANQVVLVVNTASKCGFTYQYEGLEALYRRFKDRGFAVIGLPSNDFGAQEPGSEQEIQRFCRLTYSVEFPMYEKLHAAKPQAHPLIRALADATGDYPKWNFHKYLIGRDGQVVASWPSRVEPLAAEVVAKIESLL